MPSEILHLTLGEGWGEGSSTQNALNLYLAPTTKDFAALTPTAFGLTGKMETDPPNEMPVGAGSQFNNGAEESYNSVPYGYLPDVPDYPVYYYWLPIGGTAPITVTPGTFLDPNGPLNNATPDPSTQPFGSGDGGNSGVETLTDRLTGNTLEPNSLRQVQKQGDGIHALDTASAGTAAVDPIIDWLDQTRDAIRPALGINLPAIAAGTSTTSGAASAPTTQAARFAPSVPATPGQANESAATASDPPSSAGASPDGKVADHYPQWLAQEKAAANAAQLTARVDIMAIPINPAMEIPESPDLKDKDPGEVEKRTPNQPQPELTGAETNAKSTELAMRPTLTQSQGAKLRDGVIGAESGLRLGMRGDNALLLAIPITIGGTQYWSIYDAPAFGNYTLREVIPSINRPISEYLHQKWALGQGTTEQRQWMAEATRTLGASFAQGQGETLAAETPGGAFDRSLETWASIAVISLPFTDSNGTKLRAVYQLGGGVYELKEVVPDIFDPQAYLHQKYIVGRQNEVEQSARSAAN